MKKPVSPGINMNYRWFGYLFILHAFVSPVSLSATNITLGLIIICAIALLRRPEMKGRPKFQMSILITFCLLFSWAVISALLSGNFDSKEAFSDIWEYSPIVLFPFFLSVLKISKDRVISTLLVSSSIVSFLGILQYLVPSIHYPFPRQLVREDFNGFFSHHLHTGGFYSITTIISFALILFWQCDKKKKSFLWVFFFLNTTALFLTMARSYYISLSLSILILMFLKSWRWFITGGLVFVAISVLILSFPNPVNSRFRTISPTNSSNKERIYIWKAAIEMAKEHPLAGIGKGNWGEEAKKNYYPRFEKEWHYSENSYAHAHNSFLTSLAETGVIGLVLFIYFWFSVAWVLFSRLSWIERGAYDFAIVIASLVSIGNLFIAGMFENNFGTSVILLLLSLLIGLSLKESR